MEIKFISSEALRGWLSDMIGNNTRVVAPVETGGKAEFRQIGSCEEVSLNHLTTVQSAKSLVFPRVETLFSYRKEGRELQIQNFNPDSVSHTVLFGLRPCDAAAFGPLSAIFHWGGKDKPVGERTKRSILVSVSCVRHDENCFCTSVAGGPGHTEGSDLLLTPVPDGFLVEVVTPKGKALVDQYSSFFQEDRGHNKNDFLTEVPIVFSSDSLQHKLSQLFDSEIWKHQSERCLGCGACAYVCPVCACFDIQEDARGKDGRRLRCWDSCGFSLFTLHTSGHNPRENQSQRWRQRVMHKFSYMPQRLSVIGCTGCGRCSRACPVDMNLSEHLASIDGGKE